ncbi:Disintegrin and metalloproteinase domain-containing protein 12 [Habropoda laboriosa]|uniref:Disintegrin and metalloproteinase domain-containing protein 12 n=1 Tax=Habropoda laboriosa TaxID=597456 RepID=A0A0L7QKT2_9HYME|nr:Disintegrin and metalloproteinase domain-containing protein 12 [Habropoda laboriosa]
MPSDIWCSNSRCTVGGTVMMVRCKLVLVLVLLAILPDVYTESHGPSPDFSRHTLVRPRVYHGRSKRQISSTKENDIEHADVLTVGFELDGVKRVLDLRLNTDLIPTGYQQRHQHLGTYKVHTPSKVELCHYQGSIRDVPGSWVALSTCRGLRGVVFDGENLHHIHPEGESLDSDHYVYRQSDLVANHTCGNYPRKKKRRGLLARFFLLLQVIRGPYNANRHSRYVELVLVIDKKEYVALDENLDKVYQHCKDIANIINALYMPLNIFIALVGVQVWSDTDEITLSPNGDTTLSNFLRYRREKLVQDMPNDNAQLLTRITFEGGVVGKALKGPICTYEFSGGVSMDHSNVVGLVAATVAHEMGHNFGMEHDSADCLCPEEKCIMASSSGSSGPTQWSTCSLEHLALAFEHGMDYCLRNKPQKLFDSPICGNGFVESGEQCDCGLKENCDNPCCNVTTCMLHSNASCATGECCDLKTCRPKAAGTECRSAEHECDLPEYCTGQSEYCPVDVFKMDGESCNMGKAFCYHGSCRTHNDQCKLLWGATGTSSDAQCYEMNNRGTKHGNCGYNRVDSSYFKCTDENLLCGMLHCKHLNERLEFGMESVAILSHSFINNGGKIIPCRSAIVDLGLNQVDPGLSPDGAKCAPGKMCVNQKCMPVADLRASVSGGKACPNNCGGNGVCNSLGHCHCNHGFRPPDCTQPGVGGSEDSGPAEDPNARNDFIMALYIVFLGIVPMVALSLFGVWYVRNPGQYWKKGMISTYVSSLDRVTEKRTPHAFTSRGARRGNSSHTLGKNFYERVAIFFAPRQESSSSSANRIFTISNQLPPKEKLQITKTNLISTTNPDVINCSNSIEYRKSMLLSSIEQSVGNRKSDNSDSDRSAVLPPADSQARRNSHKTELGLKIAERIQQMQKKPTKNIKGLTLKTEVKFEHLNESPGSSSGVAPTTGDPLLHDEKPCIKAPAPFYNKKPPPPPTPAQTFKPKI